jgi:hypothetical protein
VRNYVRCRCEKSVIICFKIIINITGYLYIYFIQSFSSVRTVVLLRFLQCGVVIEMLQ